MTGRADTAAVVGLDPDTAAFQEAASRGRLVLPRCGSCGRHHWYPRGICPFCLSTHIRWEESPGQGRIYSVTIFGRGGADTVIAYVEIDEGLRLLTNILTDDPAGVTIGQRVEVAFAPGPEGGDERHPVFRVIAEG